MVVDGFTKSLYILYIDYDSFYALKWYPNGAGIWLMTPRDIQAFQSGDLLGLLRWRCASQCVSKDSQARIFADAACCKRFLQGWASVYGFRKPQRPIKANSADRNSDVKTDCSFGAVEAHDESGTFVPADRISALFYDRVCRQDVLFRFGILKMFTCA